MEPHRNDDDGAEAAAHPGRVEHVPRGVSGCLTEPSPQRLVPAARRRRPRRGKGAAQRGGGGAARIFVDDHRA
jgi:hypothetical protein